MTELLFKLLVGHAIADYPLQGDFLAKAKNHKSPIPGIPWVHGLFWHSLIHAGFVLFITQSINLALIELFIHMGIDYLKCNGNTNFNLDQTLHIICKLGYSIYLINGV